MYYATFYCHFFDLPFSFFLLVSALTFMFSFSCISIFTFVNLILSAASRVFGSACGRLGKQRLSALQR